MRLRATLLAAFAAAAVIAVPAAAAPDCRGLPKHSNLPVVDAANAIPAETEAYLVADLMRYRITGNEAIVAVTVPNLGGDDVSSFARRLFDCWGIGEASSNDGVLILVAMREQRVRIEAGAGLEDELSEADLEAAIDTMVAPLRQGDIGGGLRAAAVSVAGELGEPLPDTRRNPTGGLPRVPAVPTAVPTAPGDVVDDLPGAQPDVPGFPVGAPGVTPYRIEHESPGSGFFGFVPVIVVVLIVGSVLRRLIRGGASLMSGGDSSWRGGFPGHAAGSWGTPSLLRGGGWSFGGGSDSDSDSGSSFGGSSGSSSFGSSGSFGGGSSSGGSSGGSFGGGSSGGGGASGSW